MKLKRDSLLFESNTASEKLFATCVVCVHIVENRFRWVDVEKYGIMDHSWDLELDFRVAKTMHSCI